MKLIYPTKDEIMEYFKSQSGFRSVYDIAAGLVTPHAQRNVALDEEWKHVQGFLHQLKVEGFLLVENEGQDLVNERFSSTPDRIEKYFQKDKFIDISDLAKKTESELQEIMRQTISNAYVSDSIYNKAKLELEFRKSPEEILKLSPEFYGIGLNLRPLWAKVSGWFKK